MNQAFFPPVYSLNLIKKQNKIKAIRINPRQKTICTKCLFCFEAHLFVTGYGEYCM